MRPNSKMPDMTSVVITGRRMKSSGTLMADHFGFAGEFVEEPVAAAALTLTFTPGASRNWPSVTTVSPAFNPLFMTVSPW